MDTRWAAASGLTVAAVAAIAAAWAFRTPDAPAPAPTARPESVRQEGAAAVARSGPASPEPSVAPPSASLPAPAPSISGPIRQAPRFDVVRVESDGAAVVAGHGEPGATITLLVDGQPAGEAVTDANGQFVILPPPLVAGERALSLSSRAKDGTASASAQAVTIFGAQEGHDRVVALAEPGAPTRILSDAAPQPSDEARIRAVEAEQGGAFYASGSSPAGAAVRLYLNGGLVAETRANAQGAWSVRIAKGMTPGAYQVRADHLDGAGKVASRAEVTFDYPAQTANAAPAKPAAGAPVASAKPAAPTSVARAPSPPADARPAGTTVPQVRAQQVIRGDSLWRMSAKLYGSGQRYTEIYQANAGQIRNPNLIYPGQIFVAPEKP